MVINVHAGHNPDGKVACGAIGFIWESTEARHVKTFVIGKLREQGHTVYDCTCEDGTSQGDVLSKIVDKCNSHDADLDVSIHFNAGAGDVSGDGASCGTEVLVYSAEGRAAEPAQRIVNAISEMGFRNRGVKERPGLYILRKTKAPALLVECCFVDDVDDVVIYSAERMADAIVRGITGVAAGESDAILSTASDSPSVAQVEPAPASTEPEVAPVQPAVSTVGDFQSWLNGNYGTGLIIDGIFGRQSKKAAVTAWQLIANEAGAYLTIDGIFGKRSKAYGNHMIVKNGSRGNLVCILQGMLIAKGFLSDMLDGIAGVKTEAALTAFQGAAGLSADGVCGANTWYALFN